MHALPIQRSSMQLSDLTKMAQLIKLIAFLHDAAAEGPIKGARCCISFTSSLRAIAYLLQSRSVHHFLSPFSLSCKYTSVQRQENKSKMNQGRPQCPPPWISEFDFQSQRWFFINQQTGERSWNFPQYGGPQNYNHAGYGGQSNYGGGYENRQEPQAKPSHAGRNAALAAGGGLLAGALLMHEGHKVEEGWDREKERFEDRVDYDRDRFEDRVDYDRDRIEDRVDYDRERFDDRVAYDEQRVEDFPEDAARWTGEKVQEVEDIPGDVAGWAGRKEQEVQDFGDDVRDSYDDGRDEQRYHDDSRYDDDRRDDDGW